jgi:NTE family protein
MKKGLVLSGGGVLGMAHIGLIKVLEEQQIEIDYISGTSAGALIGALHAAAIPAEEMIEFFKSTPLFNWSYYSLHKPGWFLTDPYSEHLAKYLSVDTFEALQKQLFVTATDIASGECHIFKEGPLVNAVLASSAVPGFFTPVEIDGRLYSDGGIVNNFPIEPLKDVCDKIVGSFVSPVKPVPVEELNTSFKVMRRAFELTTYTRSSFRLKSCELLFQPLELYNYSWYDTSKIDEIFEIGYREAQLLLPKIRDYLTVDSNGDWS